MTVDKSQPFVIPTIDIAPYLKDPSSPEAQRIIAEVRDACMNTGFFSLVGHGISKELQERVFNASKVFFALPLDEKRKMSAPPLLNRGYEQIGSQALQEDTKPDMKEVSCTTPHHLATEDLYRIPTHISSQGYYVGMHVSNDSEQAKLHPEMVGENIFPPQIPAEVMKEPTEQYYNEVFEVGCKVMEILAKGLPYGDDIFKEFLSDNPICALRMLHYPPQVESDEKQLGAGAHTDFGKFLSTRSCMNQLF
jgi:isopenicillin N synthase-like dioxygenase